MKKSLEKILVKSETIGDFFRYLRESNKYTVMELSEKLSISCKSETVVANVAYISFISAVENHRVLPSPLLIRKYISCFRLNPQMLAELYAKQVADVAYQRAKKRVLQTITDK